jgi:hypothetical protein
MSRNSRRIDPISHSAKPCCQGEAGVCRKAYPDFWRNRIGQTGAIIAPIWFVLAVLASPFKSKSRLEAENTVLRHQLIVLRRK